MRILCAVVLILLACERYESISEPPRERHARTVAEHPALVGRSIQKAPRPTRRKIERTRRGKKLLPCGAQLPDEASISTGGRGLGAVASRAWLWPNGSTLRVAFVDGDDDARRAVARLASQWSEYANIDFDFDFADDHRSAGRPPPDILIRFDDAACNSMVGTSAHYRIQSGYPSMNLCNIDERYVETDEHFRRVVLHEFGHALGLEHEHQSPHARFDWDKPNVYAYYARIGWDQAKVDEQVFRQLSGVTASEYDEDSVMHYWFPPEFTRQRTVYTYASVLSPIDKREIAELYPAREAEVPERKTQRLVALRNATNETLDVRVVVETEEDGEWVWRPSSRPAKGVSATLRPGDEWVASDLVGRRAKVIATDRSGNRWSDNATSPVRLVDRHGYLDEQVQTYVITIEGDPDGPKFETADALFAGGLESLDNGRLATARKRMRAFTKRYRDDWRVPWAQLAIMRTWFDGGNYLEAIYAANNVIVKHPKSDAAPFAWFYGGASAFELGSCASARAYFKAVAHGAVGLGRKWREAARLYLAVIGKHRATYCD